MKRSRPADVIRSVITSKAQMERLITTWPRYTNQSIVSVHITPWFVACEGLGHPDVTKLRQAAAMLEDLAADIEENRPMGISTEGVWSLTPITHRED